MAEDFDLIVLGGGSAGYTAAIRAAQLGLKAVIVERERVGGVCLHKGCIPTKVMLEGADVLDLVKRAGALGVRAGEPQLDYPRLRQRQVQVVEQLYTNLRGVIAKKGIEVIEGSGCLTSAKSAVVTLADASERSLAGRQVLIATGSRPRELAAFPCDGVRVLNSDQLLAQEELPESLVVVGGGAVGLEFASFFLDAGREVTIVEALPRLLPAEDRDVSEGIARALTARGARVLTGATVSAAEVGEGGVVVSLQQGDDSLRLEASHVLVAVGRQGNVEGLGLELTGARVEGGYLAVVPGQRTEDSSVFAAGDVTGGLLLAHVAAAEGFVAAEAVVGREVKPLDYVLAPRVVYSRPQMAAVGLTEEQALARGLAVRTRRFSFRNNSMAQIHGETDGFAKLVYEQESGRLLGAHVLGAVASELLPEATLALSQGLGLSALAESVYAHPTLGETLHEAARLSAGVSMYW